MFGLGSGCLGPSIAGQVACMKQAILLMSELKEIKGGDIKGKPAT